MENLALIDAYNKQEEAYAAYSALRAEMYELRPQLHAVYDEIGMLQEQYNQVYGENQEEWRDFKQTLAEYGKKVGAKIEALNEAKELQEKFAFMAKDSDVSDGKSELYEKTANFFLEMQSHFIIEKEALLQERRSLESPDNTAWNELLATLKQKRAEQREMMDRYHSIKEQLTENWIALKQAKQEYREIKNSDFCDLRKEREYRQHREDILARAKIPKEFWETAVIREGEKIIDIYWGADKDHAHGHVSLDSTKVIYTREPKLSTEI